MLIGIPTVKGNVGLAGNQKSICSSCYVVANDLPVFCALTLWEAAFKGDPLADLREVLSRQPSIQTIAQLSLACLSQYYNERIRS